MFAKANICLLFIKRIPDQVGDDILRATHLPRS